MNMPITSEMTLEALQKAARLYAGEISVRLLNAGYKKEALHCYTDADGMPVYWKVRLKHPDTGEKWIRSFSQSSTGFQFKEPDFKSTYPQGNGKKPLYRLHELLSNSEQLVFIVEGEQKADALAKLGLIATTSGSSGSVNAAYWDLIARRNVRIWRDYDGAGSNYQDEVKVVLESLGCVVSIVDVDALGLPVKDDVIDWLAMRKEQGLETTAADILALPLVNRDVVNSAVNTETEVTESVTAESPPHEEPVKNGKLSKDDVVAAIAELACLSALEFELVKRYEAKRLGLSVSYLEKEVKRLRTGDDDSKQGRAIEFICEDVEPHGEPVDACELFDLILDRIVSKHTIADPVFKHYIVLWGVATWFIDAFRAIPYLHITAPLKNSGKSNLLDVVLHFAFRALVVSDITGSALFRVIEMYKPTLLIDEVDELLGKSDSNGLTGLLNDGYKATGKVIRCVGDDHTPRQFNVFGFKALCGIGQLSKSTTASRCVKVSVRPMVHGEHIEDILYVSAASLEEIHSKLKRLQADYFDAVANYDGQHVNHLVNRDRQIWSAIYAVAAIGGTKWIDRLKCAERVINDSRIEVLDDKIQLLADIKQVFESMRLDAIHTSELIERLSSSSDSLWATWTIGKPIEAKQLATLLSDFGIGSKNVRMGQLQKKGYRLEDFKEAFNRYLIHAPAKTPNSAVPPSQANDSKAYSQKSAVPEYDAGTAENTLKPLQTKGWDAGTANNPIKQEEVKNEPFGTGKKWSSPL